MLRPNSPPNTVPGTGGGGASTSSSWNPSIGGGPQNQGQAGPQLPQAPTPPAPAQSQQQQQPPAPQAPQNQGGPGTAQYYNQTTNSNIPTNQWQRWIDEGRQNPNGTWRSSKMCNGQPCPDSGDHPDACPDGWQAHGIDDCRPAPGGGGAGGGPGGGGGGGWGGGGGGGMTGMFGPDQFAQFRGMWDQLGGGPVADPTGDFYRRVLGGGPNPFEAMANQQMAEQQRMLSSRLADSGATGGQLALGNTMQNQAIASGAAQNRLDALNPALGFLGAQTEGARDRNAQQQTAGWQGFLGLGNLANDRYGIDVNRELGLGQLDLGWEGAAMDRDRFGEDRYRFDAGYGQQGMNREQDLLSMLLNSQQNINAQQQGGQGAAWGAGGQMFGQGMTEMFRPRGQ